MQYLFIIGLGSLLLLIVYIFIDSYIFKNNKKYTFNGKIRKSILTKTELEFYNKLKKVVNYNKYIIMPKVRLADIFETKDKKNFNKVNAKHVDFTICNLQTKPLIFVELDDYTHNFKINSENDKKKNIIFESNGIKLYRIKLNEIDDKLEELKQVLNSI